MDELKQKYEEAMKNYDYIDEITEETIKVVSYGMLDNLPQDMEYTDKFVFFNMVCKGFGSGSHELVTFPIYCKDTNNFRYVIQCEYQTFLSTDTPKFIDNKEAVKEYIKEHNMCMLINFINGSQKIEGREVQYRDFYYLNGLIVYKGALD